MKTQVQTKKERQYFIDWLRIGLILSVFFYHIGMIFNSWDWHIKSDEHLLFLEPIMGWLHYWRMPLLFLVSGVGTYYALGFRSSKQYIKERFNRLLIPAIVGIFVLVPVQVYIEKINEFSSLGDLYMHWFDGIYPSGNFSWHHLWFIIYLFLISLLISPFIKYSRTDHFARVKNWMVKKTTVILGLNWVLVVLLLSQVILRQYFPDSTHALYNDWAFFAFYLIFFLCGFILFTSEAVIQALCTQRRLYLIQSILVTIFYSSIASIFEPSILSEYMYHIFGIIIAWSCGMAVIGYCKSYFNKDHKFRKTLNEAIYPFYLLHQPIIVVVGYIILQWRLPILVKGVLITLVSLLLAIGLYWIISKFNVLRIVFGMKKKTTVKTCEMRPMKKVLILDK